MTELLPLLVALVLGAVLGAVVATWAVRSARPAADTASLAAERAAVDALVRPVSETLRQVQVDLARAERDRAAAHADLARQVQATALGARELGEQTGRLASALRRSDVRGQWGEMQLRRIVESSGLLEHVHFEEQSSTRDDAGTLLRADLVVHLADGRDVVVDSKAPLSAFLDAVDCEDDDRRRDLLARHAADVARHIDTLGSKDYWRRYDSPAFVVLFLPSEALLSSALDQRPDLLQRAFDRDVVLATPTTLLALLRTVAHTWRQDAAARSTRRVHELAVELHGRIGVLGRHLARLGRELDSAVDAYNGAVGSLESRVLVTARTLAELGVVEGGEDGGLPAPTPITRTARSLAAPELVDPTAPQDDLAPRLPTIEWDDADDWAFPLTERRDADHGRGDGLVGSAG